MEICDQRIDDAKSVARSNKKTRDSLVRLQSSLLSGYPFQRPGAGRANRYDAVTLSFGPLYFLRAICGQKIALSFHGVLFNLRFTDGLEGTGPHMKGQ